MLVSPVTWADGVGEDGGGDCLACSASLGCHMWDDLGGALSALRLSLLCLCDSNSVCSWAAGVPRPIGAALGPVHCLHTEPGPWGCEWLEVLQEEQVKAGMDRQVICLKSCLRMIPRDPPPQQQVRLRPQHTCCSSLWGLSSPPWPQAHGQL